MKKLIFICLGVLSLVANGFSSVPKSLALKIQTCAACHGEMGVSLNPAWPNLAGQHASYLRKQLLDYKTGKSRRSVLMRGVTANLSRKDIRELANYYASLSRAGGKTPEKYSALGASIYRGGDASRGISACIACHGPKGTGNAEAGFPVLTGQNALYTVEALLAFKKKVRHNDLNAIMQNISARMTRKEMEAVAYYMQGLY